MNEKSSVKIGIGRKYRRLFLIVIILIILVFLAANIVELVRLSAIVTETNAKQREEIIDFSDQTLVRLYSQTMTNNVHKEAKNASFVFSYYQSVADSIATYTKRFFEDPERFPHQRISEPDPFRDGEVSVQLLTEEGVDLKDPKVQERVEEIGALSDILYAIFYDDPDQAACIALPEDGLVIEVDGNPSSKYDENGNLVHLNFREREWYKKAVETGEDCFTDAYRDLFTGKYIVTYSMPVYQDGKLVAVVALDLFLDELDNDIKAYDGEAEILCVLNNEGEVIFSSAKDGILVRQEEGERQDLRKTEDKEFSDFIKKAYESTDDETPSSLPSFKLNDKEYYLVAAPISGPGWMYLYALEKSQLDAPIQDTIKSVDEWMVEGVSSFHQEITHVFIVLVILLILLIICSLLAVRKVSGRIVRPLEKMTKRIGSIRGEDLAFEVEDTYRTGDEIEELAESFSDMSARTLKYVNTVRTVTAEKERIGAELNMATAIQASQLPRLFPAFPDRKEFSLYASMTPAKEVGGDFYDFYLVDSDHIALVMADVSGKGVPAALFMMVSRVLIKSRLQDGDSPGEALKNVNNQLCENNDAGLFVTVWLAVVEISTGKGVSVNAGHEHPAIRRGNGPFTLLEYEHSLAVAAIEGVDYDERTFEMNPGDAVFIYTDGVAEAHDAKNELFGMERMIDALNVNPTAEPEELIENVAKGIQTFVDGAEQFDDITMLCFRYNGTEQK